MKNAFSKQSCISFANLKLHEAQQCLKIFSKSLDPSVHMYCIDSVHLITETSKKSRCKVPPALYCLHKYAPPCCVILITYFHMPGMHIAQSKNSFGRYIKGNPSFPIVIFTHTTKVLFKCKQINIDIFDNIATLNCLCVFDCSSRYRSNCTYYVHMSTIPPHCYVTGSVSPRISSYAYTQTRYYRAGCWIV